MRLTLFNVCFICLIRVEFRARVRGRLGCYSQLVRQRCRQMRSGMQPSRWQGQPIVEPARAQHLGRRRLSHGTAILLPCADPLAHVVPQYPPTIASAWRHEGGMGCWSIRYIRAASVCALGSVSFIFVSLLPSALRGVTHLNGLPVLATAFLFARSEDAIQACKS